MIEYSRHIEEYSIYWQADFSRLVPSDQWGDKKLAEEYLKKYWLPEDEYLIKWKKIQDNIFDPNEDLPNLVYQPGYEMIALVGGRLFVEAEFKRLQEIMVKNGDKYFIIIQHSQEWTGGEPMFRMKFPVISTWEELVSGNYISAVLLEMYYNQYYIFSDSGNWGRFCANDYIHPLNIFGFKPELSSDFKKHFTLSVKASKRVSDELPPKYRELINPDVSKLK
ncbi:MAG: hypothetical protein ACO1N9_08690 [Flavobacterium sp.]